MKGRKLIFAGLVASLVGLLLVLFRTALADGGVVTAAGVIFVLAGALNMAVFLRSKDKDGQDRLGIVASTFGWVASAAAVILGLAMLIFSAAFVAIISFMFGILILFTAIFQFFVLIFSLRDIRMSGLFFIVPALLVGAAIFIFMRRPDGPGESLVNTVSGAAFIFFGVFTALEGLCAGYLRRKAAKLTSPSNSDESAQDYSENQ